MMTELEKLHSRSRLYTHRLLYHLKPKNWRQRRFENYDIVASLSSLLEIQFDKLIKFGDESRDGRASLDFSISEDTLVQINLDPDLGWRWSTDLDAISTKDEKYHGLYGDLEYGELASSDFIDMDKVDLNTTYKSIKFKAKFNNGIRNKPVQSMNFNIELLQSNGEWLPVTIDPDIRNPHLINNLIDRNKENRFDDPRIKQIDVNTIQLERQSLFGTVGTREPSGDLVQ